MYDMVYKLTIKDNIFDVKVNKDKENIIDKDINKSLKILLKRKYKIKDPVSFLIESFNLDVEKCRVCGKVYPNILFNFKITSDNINISGFEYLKPYIYCYMKNKNCEGKNMNSNSKQFISKVLKISEDDALKYIKSKNKSPFYVENWDSLEDYKKYQTRDEDFFESYSDITYEEFLEKNKLSTSRERLIKKYGEESYKEISKSKDSMSLKYMLSKYNDIEKAKHMYQFRKKSVLNTLNSLTDKYGVKDGTLKHVCKIEKIKKNNTKEGYIERYGESEGSKKYINFLKNASYKSSKQYYLDNDNLEGYNKKVLSSSTTLEKFIDYYGDCKKARDEWNKNIIKRLTSDKKSVTTRVSKESVSFFNKLVDYLVINYNFKYDDFIYSKNEISIITEKGVRYFDFCIDKMKLLIEYNGVAFHPKKHTMNDVEWRNWRSVKGNNNADILYEKQKYKINEAIKNGYIVLEIWSDDTFEYNFDTCLEFIKNKNKNKNG